MGIFRSILLNLPEVKSPDEKKVSFSKKLKWTLTILVSYFLLTLIPIYGLGAAALERFDFLAIILGTTFGSVISLGIGPIVTASIVLQLLVGAKILNIDLHSADGKRYFQGLQKMLGILFTMFEATVFVLMGGLSPAAGFSPILLIFQLFLGGILIIYMDEVVSKYGFGSGISLFIVAGVASQLFVRLFSFEQVGTERAGRLWVLFSNFAAGDISGALLILLTIATTAIIFFAVVYVQAIKVEIPLSFGRVRGFGIRWPLSFLYTSNIPVILTAALLANVQLVSTLWRNPIAASISNWFNPPAISQVNEGLLGLAFRGGITPVDIAQVLFYSLVMIGGGILFAVFWVKTSGMDASSQAQQIMRSGLQIPGFRRDPRLTEAILNRYIMPLTVMGGATVGLLAALADILGALVRGTGILLAVTIIYRMYEEIAQQHAFDMHPALRKFVEK